MLGIRDYLVVLLALLRGHSLCFSSCCPAALLPVSSAGSVGSRQLAVQPVADVQRGGRASDEAGGENPERRPLRARQHHQH